MGSASEQVLVPQGRHMRQVPQKSRRVRWLALGTAAMLLMVFALGGFLFARLRSNVQTASMDVGELAANLASGPLDILVIGSDTRAGSNSAYGNEEDAASGARADVMMLVQVSENREMVNVISFPRDLMVDIPKCTDADDGTVYPASEDTQINESLGRGGPGCAVATVSNLTGIAIDHFMLLDFNAVKALSSVVGGVDVCVSKEIDDPYSGLKLQAGTSSVEGEQALAFLRSRHGFGDGSDTSRIQAQQSFLASLLRKVQSEGTLSNPGMLINIAEAVTQNVTVDSGLTNISTLVGVGSVFAKVDLSKVVFATVPNEPYVYDANKLQVSADADDFFKKLQRDQSLVNPEPEASAPAASAESTETTEAALDFALSVQLSNASGVEGRADDLVSKVTEAGFAQATSVESGTVVTASEIYYPYGFEAEAQAIADLFGISTVTASEQHIGIGVVLGSDLAEVDKVEKKDAGIAGGATGQTADQVTCQTSFG